MLGCIAARRRGTVPPADPPNLLANGFFTSDAAGWTKTVNDGTIVATGGKGLVTCLNSPYVLFASSFATVIGASYSITADISEGSGAYFGVRKSDAPASFVNLVEIAAGNGAGQSATFSATATTTYVVIQVNTDNEKAKFDNIVAAVAP